MIVFFSNHKIKKTVRLYLTPVSSMVKETIKQHFGKSMDQIFTTIKRDGLPIDQELLLNF